jgi:hypothetical protein
VRLRGLELNGTKAARRHYRSSFFRAYRAHQTAPTDATSDERIARATIDINIAEVFVEDRPWPDPRSELRPEEIRADATLMTDYIASFGNFFCNAELPSSPTTKKIGV